MGPPRTSLSMNSDVGFVPPCSLEAELETGMDPVERRNK